MGGGMMRAVRIGAGLAVVGALLGCEDQRVEAISAAAAAPSETTTASGPAPAERKFRDWIAVCDNGNACAAFGPTQEGDTGFVRVMMQPGGEARPGVTVGLWASERATGRDMAVVVDGRRFAVSPDPEADSEAPIGVVENEADELIRAMAAGRAMTIELGGQSTPVNLAGASAAFLWIDERQGRLDTTTALVRRGERPVSAVPPAPGLPRVITAAAVDQSGLPETPVLPDALAADPGVRECLAETSHMDPEFGGPSVARLADGVELWSVLCFTGAYNFGTRYWMTDANGRDPRAVDFPEASGERVSDLVNAGYDPATRTLDAFNKGRGLGDCGVAQTWAWNGRAFVLLREARMTECWGVTADLWPTTWRTAE